MNLKTKSPKYDVYSSLKSILVYCIISLNISLLEKRIFTSKSQRPWTYFSRMPGNLESFSQEYVFSEEEMGISKFFCPVNMYINEITYSIKTHDNMFTLSNSNRPRNGEHHEKNDKNNRTNDKNIADNENVDQKIETFENATPSNVTEETSPDENLGIDTFFLTLFDTFNVEFQKFLKKPKYFTNILNELSLMKFNGKVIEKSSLLDYHISSKDLIDTSLIDAYGFCPTLIHCVGHQACVFRFGNEFCQTDALPNARKFLVVTVTCSSHTSYKDKLLEYVDFIQQVLENGMDEDDHLALALQNLHQLMDSISARNEDIAFIKYTSATDKGIRSYNKTKFELQISKNKDVFGKLCPHPSDAKQKYGFVGYCQNHPINSDATNELMWGVLSRSSGKCRQELLETFCAHEYNKQGFCFPPYLFDKTNKENMKLSFDQMPRNGDRPKDELFASLSQNRLSRLIPVKIGFIILAHGDIKGLLDLLNVMVSPEHYYVIHFDIKNTEGYNKLKQNLEILYRGYTNIRLLPQSRSFNTSWGSFGIVRSILEGIEELLRMGLWDHVFVISGADFPLRSVDDMAASLAEYRSYSLITKLRERKKNSLGMHDKDNTYWYGCDRHVYKLDYRRLAVRAFGHSMWILLTREYAQFVVSEDRPMQLTAFHWALITSAIPDECYFGTMLYHSPFSRKYLPFILHYQKPFYGRNVDNLCRHLDETDLCGSGPSNFEEMDVPLLKNAAHRSFMARKFSKSSIVKKNITEFVTSNDYYKSMEKYFSQSFLRALANMALSSLKENHSFLSISKYQVLPAFKNGDPCCSQISYLQMFLPSRVWLQFEAENEAGSRIEFRSSFIPHQPKTCYNHGILRGIHVNTRRSVSHPLIKHSDDRVGFPFPVALAGKQVLYIQYVIDYEKIIPSCAGSRPITNLQYLEYPGSSGGPRESSNGDNVVFFQIDAFNQNRNSSCSKEIFIALNNKENQQPGTLAFQCDNFYYEEGVWTVEMTQKNVTNPFIYRQTLLLVNDSDSQSILKYVLPAIRNLWSLEEISDVEKLNHIYKISY